MRPDLEPIRRAIQDATFAAIDDAAVQRLLTRLAVHGLAVVPVEPAREMWAASGTAVIGTPAGRVMNHDLITETVWRAALAANPYAPESSLQKMQITPETSCEHEFGSENAAGATICNFCAVIEQ